MDRFGFNEIGSYVLSIAIATMIAALLVSQLQKSKKAAAVSLGVGLLCFLLGCIVPYALLEISGYTVISDNVFIVGDGNDGPAVRAPEPPRASDEASADSPSESAPAEE